MHVTKYKFPVDMRSADFGNASHHKESGVPYLDCNNFGTYNFEICALLGYNAASSGYS